MFAGVGFRYIFAAAVAASGFFAKPCRGVAGFTVAGFAVKVGGALDLADLLWSADQGSGWGIFILSHTFQPDAKVAVFAFFGFDGAFFVDANGVVGLRAVEVGGAFGWLFRRAAGPGPSETDEKRNKAKQQNMMNFCVHDIPLTIHKNVPQPMS